MDLGIAGKVALVTAGTRGIGLGIAIALAAEGVRVAVAARTEADVKKTAAAIGRREISTRAVRRRLWRYCARKSKRMPARA